MTEQQKKAVEEEVIRFSESYRWRLANVTEIYEKGMLEVLDNPEKYGLVTASVHENLTKKIQRPCEVLRQACRYTM